MKNLIISALILFALACSSLSLEPIEISHENGMTILANFTSTSANQSDMDANATINQTNQTQINNSTNGSTSESTNDTDTGLWSWGKIPIGYELNQNGSLTKLANQEWKPSI
ncbi:MAG: hypothetical protein JW999_00650 [Methanotrichaceae archaeon]|nr:hypothetical protein [Methanotrichaceae archaeon]